MPISNFSQSKPLFEFLRKQQDNEKFNRGLEITATFILISFFLFFAIKPTAYTISALLGDIKSKEVLVKQMRQKIANVVQAQDSFSKIQAKYSLIESSLPDTPRFNQAYNQIIGCAQSSGIQFGSLSFNLLDSAEFTQSVPVSLISTNIGNSAPFPQIINLVNKITNNRRLIDVKSITFNLDKTNSGTNSQPDNIKFNFSPQILYWKSNAK